MDLAHFTRKAGWRMAGEAVLEQGIGWCVRTDDKRHPSGWGAVQQCRATPRSNSLSGKCPSRAQLVRSSNQGAELAWPLSPWGRMSPQKWSLRWKITAPQLRQRWCGLCCLSDARTLEARRICLADVVVRRELYASIMPSWRHRRN